MSRAPTTVTVTILEKEYRVACQPGEEEAVMASALHLDQRMREIRQTGKIIGTERIAVMAALNMAHDLLTLEQQQQETERVLEKRMRQLQEQVEVALNQFNQLEL